MSRRTYPIPNKNLSGSDYIQNKRAKQLFSGTSNLAKTIQQQNGNFPLLTPLGKVKPYQGTFGLSGRTNPGEKTYCLNTSHSYRDLLAITKGKYLLTPPNISNESIIELKDVSEAEKLYNGIYYVYIYFNTTTALYYMNPAYPDPSGNYIANRIQYDVTGNANERIIVDPSYVLTYVSQSCVLKNNVSSNVGINNDYESRYSFNRTINLALLSGFSYPSKFSLDYDPGDCINANNDLQSKYAVPVIPTPPVSAIYFVAGGQGFSQNILGYSSDGSIWLPSVNGNSIFRSYVKSIKYNGNLFNTWLAVGGNSTDTNGNVIAYSTDAQTWTASTSVDPSGNANNILNFANGVEWVQSGSVNRWIVVGEGKGASPRSIIYSTDANTWSIGSDPSGNDPFGPGGYGNAVASNNLPSPNFNIISVGVGGTPSVNINMVYSTNGGVTWSPILSPFFTPPLFNNSSPPRTIIYAGSNWIVGGISNNFTFGPIFYSIDNGFNWSQSSVGSPYPTTPAGVCFDIAWNGSVCVAVGLGMYEPAWNILYSTNNGQTWLPSNSSNIIDPQSVTWQNTTPTLVGRWVIVGSNGTNIAYSTDAINWTLSNNGSNIFQSPVLSVGSSSGV